MNIIPLKTSIPLDMSRISLIADTAEEKAEVFSIFFRSAAGCVNEMSQAIIDSSCKPYTEAAHSLKGAAANMGMNKLAGICTEAMRVEDVAQDGKRLFDQLCQELELIKQYLITIRMMEP